MSIVKPIRCTSVSNLFNFDRLVHLVGFTIDIYYSALPCECQISQ